MNVTCIKLIYKSLRRVLYHSLWKNDVVDFLVVTSIDEFTGEFGQVEPVHLRYLRADEKLNKNKPNVVNMMDLMYVLGRRYSRF